MSTDAYTTEQGTYALANAASAAGDRFAALSAVYDPVTFRHLDEVGIAPGWHCLELGAGGGSVARWMGERVGPDGRVLAVDLDTRWLAGLAGGPVELRSLDVRTDELPAAAFDLVHARLVLVHLPERAEVLRRLVRSLRPGGWLVTSEFTTLTPVGPPPAEELAALVGRVNQAFGALLAAHGADMAYGLHLGPEFSRAGLVEVHVDGHLECSWGGSPYLQLMRANIEQVRDELVDRGLTSDDMERYLLALENPMLNQLSPVLFTARGRRP